MTLLEIILTTIICSSPFILILILIMMIINNMNNISTPSQTTVKLKEGDIVFVGTDPKPYTIIKVNNTKNTYTAKNEKGACVGIGADSIRAGIVRLANYN